ncbi:MAG: hypothetical protein NTY02_10660, partial [Acidobacteria bacterium]|nr:hypothetical protein [Acidobacteriota bacterium]
AQRGGARDGAERPLNRTTYDGGDYGITFPVPPGLDLYTPDQPGAYRQVFTERRIVYLVNPQHTEESIVIRYSDNVSEADLSSYRTTLDTSPPQAELPGFLKVGVADIAIGKDGSKKALNFVYTITAEKTDKSDRMEMTLRQVVFLHKGRGFTVSCETASKRFDKADKDTFEKFLSTIEFR